MVASAVMAGGREAKRIRRLATAVSPFQMLAGSSRGCCDGRLRPSDLYQERSTGSLRVPDQASDRARQVGEGGPRDVDIIEVIKCFDERHPGGVGDRSGIGPLVA